jgi:hypothetical protein
MKPSRTLNRIELYNETLIFQDVYFATDKHGYGKVYDSEKFLGQAVPDFGSTENAFLVNIFGRLCPSGNFRRRKFKSQTTANSALIRYVEKALQQNIRSYKGTE